MLPNSRNIPLGVAVLVLVLSSFRLRGIYRPYQKLPFRTKSGTMDPPGIILLLRSVYLIIILLVLIITGLRPSSHNKYFRVSRSFKSSLAVFHVVGANS